MKINAVFCAHRNNDLIRALKYSGYDTSIFSSPSEAVHNAKTGQAVLFLSDHYPVADLSISSKLIQKIIKKKLKLYAEYPLSVADTVTGLPCTIKYERLVVCSDFFGNDLKLNSILMINGCWLRSLSQSINHSEDILCLAKVAGYDELTFGMPSQKQTVLSFLNNDPDLLISTACLSVFITARYAPKCRWKGLWQGILHHLGCDVKLDWIPDVEVMYEKKAALVKNSGMSAFSRNAKWAYDNILVKIDQKPLAIEGFEAGIDHNGTQFRRALFRSDCNAEIAMELAHYAKTRNDPEYFSVSEALMERILNTPAFFHNDPRSPMYGLCNWYENGCVFYGDDDARVMLSALSYRAVTGSSCFDENILKCVFANLRTAGKLGFRHERLEKDLGGKRWQDLHEEEFIHLSPHYQSYLWAVYIWAFALTGIQELYEKSDTALRMCMDAFPDDLIWTNSLTAEISRLLLPLSFMARVNPTEEHLKWLKKAAYELLKYQQSCGAIRDSFKDVSKGRYPPPQSNEKYGTTEASLIQHDGDPACDLLYAANWAFIGLHETSYAIDDANISKACDDLADFFCRIQVRSKKHPELDGAWMRSFDYEKWEYFGSSADIGWAACCIESGWMNAWISTVLALRHEKRPLFDLSFKKEFTAIAPAIYDSMLK
ncbi:MAG: hypothetical protein WCY62_04570 [Clostridia bacterium]